MANRLAQETSPYLLQHKDNPVDWYPWGDEAFAKAREEDKPILLSVGYSACHWCHVMAHESFENQAIAEQMNQLFVPVKVDREERPDVDAIYMAAVQALTGRGGWPMTVFLTPEGVPFYGGTYYPPVERQGMPGFPRVLQAVSEAFTDRRQDIEAAGQNIVAHISSSTNLAPGDNLLSDALLESAFAAIEQHFDTDFGGFSPAPKFPQPMNLSFLLLYFYRTRNTRALEMVEDTLYAMADGGIYDQVGGGFHRYSTDSVWLVPHFEKMLYDNALLSRTYLEAFRITGNGYYHTVATETLDYVLREMTDAAGGFYSTQDADSEGEEGKFFLWTPPEFEAVLGDDSALLAQYFDVTEAGNFEGRNILHIKTAPDAFANAHHVRVEDLDAKVAAAKEKLYAAREQRVHPGRDDKVLSGWNGLMLRSLADAALYLDSEPYREAARRNADFLLEHMVVDGRLQRSWKDGVARIDGYLEDYGAVIDGLIATHAATFDLRYLQAARDLADRMLDLFWDEDVRGFYDTGSDQEALVARPRDLFDNATPSGNSLATYALLRLGLLTGDEKYEQRASAVLRTLAPYLQQVATSFGHLLSALDFQLSPARELALVWPEDTTDAQPFLDTVRGVYLPHLLLVGAKAGEGARATPLLQDRPLVDGQTTAYLCERFVCQAPTTDQETLRQQLIGA